MAARLIRLAVIWTFAVVAPGAAQRAGTVEVGAFARYTHLDKGLAMGTTVALGGRAAVYVGQTLAFEVDAAHASSRSVGYTPLHVRLVREAPLGSRLGVVLGAGYVRNWYGAPYQVSDGGLSTMLGLRYHLRDRVSLRLGTDLDLLIHASDRGPFAFYHGNWGLQLGVGARLRS